MAYLRERRLCELIEPSVAGLGCELVGVVLEGEGSSGGPRRVVRVFIDRETGVTVQDCESVSRQVGALLDVEDPISDSYVLEVSSPGLDRPLLAAEHFARFAGRMVRLRTTEPLQGRRKWTGWLVGCRGDSIVVREGEEAEAEERLIPLALVGKANLVPEV